MDASVCGDGGDGRKRKAIKGARIKDAREKWMQCTAYIIKAAAVLRLTSDVLSVSQNVTKRRRSVSLPRRPRHL